MAWCKKNRRKFETTVLKSKRDPEITNLNLNSTKLKKSANALEDLGVHFVAPK